MPTYAPTYDRTLDGARLRTQLEMVRDVMLAFGQLDDWMTLGQIHHMTGYPEASISARLRDLRKTGFGGYEVARRRRGKPERGLWEYRVTERGAVVGEQLTNGRATYP